MNHRKLRSLAALFSLLLLSITVPGCAGPLRDFEAEYLLLFGNRLVGESHFSLRLKPQGRYELEAYTVPAGDASLAEGAREVLERSSGIIRDGIPIPERYSYAVPQASDLGLVELEFNWQAGQLALVTAEGRTEVALAAGTQDHLSYLLLAMLMGQEARREATVPLSTPEDTRTIQLIDRGRERINLPADRSRPVQRIERRDNPGQVERVIWLAVDERYLPAVIENATDSGVVRMELQRVRWR